MSLLFFTVTKATLQSPMSVCHKNSSKNQNQFFNIHHPYLHLPHHLHPHFHHLNHHFHYQPHCHLHHHPNHHPQRHPHHNLLIMTLQLFSWSACLNTIDYSDFITVLEIWRMCIECYKWWRDFFTHPVDRRAFSLKLNKRDSSSDYRFRRLPSH